MKFTTKYYVYEKQILITKQNIDSIQQNVCYILFQNSFIEKINKMPCTQVWKDTIKEMKYKKI